MTALFFSFAIALLVEGNPQAAIELNNQAAQLFRQARYPESEKLYRQALDAASQAGAEAADTRVATLSNLATLLRVTGRFEEAERILTSLLNEQTTGQTPPLDIAHTLENLAGVCQAQGDLVRAEALARRAEKLLAAELDLPVQERVNLNLLLAAIHVGQERYADAESILHATVPVVQGAFSALAHNSLAAIAIARGDYAAAEGFARTALDRAKAALPAAHPTAAMVLNNLAQACRFQGKYLEAEAHYRRAIEIWESVVGPSHPDLAKGLMNLAAFYHERDREAGAEDLYHRAAAIFDRSLGPNSHWALVVRAELADVLRGERRYSESDRLGRDAIAAMEKAFAPDDPRLTRALAHRARLLSETRRTEEAAAVLARLRAVSQTFH
jgi:tetratricopeptide (TPR) repeat protein